MILSALLALSSIHSLAPKTRSLRYTNKSKQIQTHFPLPPRFTCYTEITSYHQASSELTLFISIFIRSPSETPKMGKRKAQSQNPADESGDEAPPQGGKKLFVLKPPKPPGQGPSPTNQPSTRMAGAAPPNQFGTTFGLPNNVSGVPPPPSPSDASSLTTLSSSPSPPPIGPRGPDDRLPPVAQATSSGFSAPLAPSALSTPPVLSAPTGPVAPTTPPAPSAPSAPSAPLKVSGPSAHFVPSAGQPYSSGPTVRVLP